MAAIPIEDYMAVCEFLKVFILVMNELYLLEAQILCN